MKVEYRELLRSKLWRLNHLYFIKDKNGNTIRFKMTPEQFHYFNNLHNRNIILKARQLGFTTQVCIIQLDAALFEGATCAMIAHTLPDAKRLFRNKIKFAYDKLHQSIKDANPLTVANSDEYVFSKGGSVTISTSFRGGTVKWLHVSEFGKICAKSPEKAREIVTGALEAVPINGYATLESTAEGRQGYFYDYCQDAEKLHLQNAELTPQDWRFFFFSWWQNPEYQQKAQKLPSRLVDYFNQLESKHGIKLTDKQKSWYYGKEKSLGSDVKREYPSIPSEAFEQSIEGAYYAKQFAWLYANGRIAEQLPDNSHQPVYTFWDLGVSDSTTIWFIRKVGDRYQVIDYYENSGEGLNHYFKVLKDKGYSYAEHVAPHDIDNRQLGANSAKSLRESARDGYLVDGEIYSVDFSVVPRTTNVNADIETVREILLKCEFDSVKCEQGLKCLEGYRKAWNDTLGTWRDKPLHDWTSHGADAFRMFAVHQTMKHAAISTNIRMGF